MTPAEVADACMGLINQQKPEVARYARIILRNRLLADQELPALSDRDACQHYYADPSGGFGWPSCVKCGAPVPTDAAHSAVRACCRTRTDEPHYDAWCASVDARVKRGQL
ncbi:hypothetical protein SEA_MITHRIL_79 [Mycobacterium phage Mithril]|uniref:Uncharacterized protein n=1 Tax=Mycobacterium phage Mithril TaxID=2653765 RepID=A0A5Q2WNQ4_9CAUD|nr:hypothetical protein SEA_MITHRIL_79 [Mycobacterium phage Mithril]